MKFMGTFIIIFLKKLIFLNNHSSSNLELIDLLNFMSLNDNNASYKFITDWTKKT